MEREFVGYKEAKQLRKLGFNETCFAGYTKKEKDLWIGYVDSQLGEQFNRDYHILAPTYSQAFRWFREKYGLLSFIDMDVYSFYRFTIYEGKGMSVAPHRTYEESELECLKKLIEIVKEKK